MDQDTPLVVILVILLLGISCCIIGAMQRLAGQNISAFVFWTVIIISLFFNAIGVIGLTMEILSN